MNEIRNRKVNMRKKVNPESIQDLESHVNNLKESIEASQIIVSNLKANPGWLLIKKSIAERLQQIEDALLDFHSFTDKGRDKLLQERVDFYEFMNQVEKHEQNILDASEMMSEAMSKLNDRKQRARIGSAAF